ncbi:AfsR/SARP family transcriptional regulator [Streptomyces herbicida]|uniref:AfsR/SARP family transcriptional regulator n=1 Tax=Streptomyces herbicida TaxID=3065675 RepID=UPI00292FD7E9|nr:hypothetical protein [Streptomyces sp. NEAU-HV9]
MKPAMRTRLAAWLAVLPALAGLLIAADVFHDAPTTVCACARDTAESPHPAADPPTPSVALRPGAHLADPKILSLTSPSPALRQAVQNLTGTAPGHSHHPGTHPGTSTRTAATHTPGPASPGPAASAIPPRRTPAQGDSTPTVQPSSSAFLPAAPQPSSPGAVSPSTSASASQPSSSAPARHVTLAQVLAAAALLAAALTGALATRRILGRHHRKDGASPAHATHASNPQTLLRSVGEPDGAARLDLALRTLAHHAAAQQGSVGLPDVRAVRIGPRTLQVLPDDPAEGPSPPFTAGNAPGWWDLSDRADLLDHEQAGQVPAPYPALTTLGHTGDDALVLVNLAQLPALLLEGDPAHITQVCTSLALEHAMNPWADDADILAIGFGETLHRLLPHSHITHTRHPAQALQDLTEQLLAAHQHPELPHRPCLIISATTLDTDTVHQVADLIEGTRTVPVTLIAPASTARALFPHAVILDAADSRPQHLDLIGADITLQRVDDTAYAQITTALTRRPAETDTATDEPTPQTATGTPGQDVAPPSGHAARAEAAAVETPGDDTQAGAPGRPPVPASDAGSDDAVFAALLAATPQQSPRPRDTAIHRTPVTNHGEAASGTPPQTHRPAQHRDHTLTSPAEPAGIGDPHAPEIRVLGPVNVDGVPHTGHGPKTAQLASLLYFRPGRTADAICTDMDPTTPWTTTTLNARLHQLRRALGTDPTGNPYVPRRTNADDPYRLHPDIRCDWTTFQHLTQHALPEEENLPQLETALQLVRGRPFDDRPLPWAEPHQQEMTTSIVDVAHTVATQRTPPGPHHNLSLARQAIATGLDVDPSAEKLYRAWMLIEHTAGNRSGLHMAISRLQQVNASLGCPLETETTHLVNELLHDSGPKRANHE